MKDLAVVIIILSISGGALGIGRLSHLSQQNARYEAQIELLEKENEALRNQLLGSFGGE